MSMGCSSSCCTACFHRYTERQGARMLTHAASCFSISMSASLSAAARSGRLVNTKSLLMPQSFINGAVAQRDAEDVLQARIIEAARFGSERLSDWTAWRPGQAAEIGDQVEPVAQFHLGIVGGVVNAGQRIGLERTNHDRGKVIGVNVARIDVIKHRHSRAQALERQ